MSSSPLSAAVHRAVKAFIYKRDGYNLLQQRDYALGLPFAGFWIKEF